MDFKTFWQAKNALERESFAADVGTTTGYCHQIAFGDKHIELGLADAIVAVSQGDCTLGELPLTDRAKRQHEIRSRRRRDRQRLKAA